VQLATSSFGSHLPRTDFTRLKVSISVLPNSGQFMSILRLKHSALCFAEENSLPKGSKIEKNQSRLIFSIEETLAGR
jgi:hypothetical protein